ncbi:CFA61 protein, partial [Amia calva]|nr:CFA61 protein [Amia calva]
MRTITSSDGTEETITARRAESADAQAISRLIRPSTEAVFGRVNVLYLLEKTNLAVTLVNAQREVVAHAAFIDYPNLGTADQADWESWLHNSYSSETCSPLNTLFMHLFVAHPDFSIGSANEIIRTVFSAVTELQFIYLFVPTSASLEPALSAIFKQVEGLQESTTDSPFTAFVCERHDHCPALHIRKARVEDHDDLTPIFAQHTNKLQSTYGDYFLAELIEAQDEDNHAAVCESEGTAVGFMSLSGDVNVHLLNECFELGLFHGLCKPHPEDILEPPSEPHGEPVIKLIIYVLLFFLSIFDLSCFSQCFRIQTAAKINYSKYILGGEDQVIFQDNCIYFIEMSDIKNVTIFRTACCYFSPSFFILSERDFCIITVPKLTPEFPLLQSFVRVIPRHTSTFGQELYVYHRSGLFKCFNVRMAKSSDRMGIESLVQNLRLRQSILEGVDLFCRARRDRDGTPLQAFVAEVLDQIVGILIIKNEEDIDYIRSHYNIENFIYFSHHRQDEHAQLLHFALNPVFQHYAKHFFKEALRLSYKSCLYYPVYPPQGELKDAYAHPLTSALNCMVPVRPRRQIVYPLEELGTNAPSRRVSEDQAPYALNHLNRKLTLEPKVTINARIVIVGSSDTGMAFLEVLAFCPHLRFNNITLISTHGFPDGCSKDLVKTNFLATSHCYSERDHAMLSLRSWVNVVEGKMKGIDRAAKHVLVSEGRKVLYDHLVLCTGQQYQVPCPTGADISQLCTNRELAVRPDQRYTGPTPSNLFTVNDQRDCLKLHNWLQQNFLHLEGNAVVYGNTIDVFTTTETMLSLGVSGSRIHLVQPPLDTAVTCFNNPAVERAVDGALRDAGVTVHHNGLLAQWNDGKDSEPITSVSFTTDTTPVKLQCSVFISFYKKGVDSDAFKAVNDACLVYDGKLVIDTAFHTNDPVVRAAGPLTKFARRYHADEWSHQVFSSREVGVQLAEALLPFFDPTLETAADLPVELDRLVPKYTGAKTRGAKLPGGYYYLHAAKPGPDTPLQAQMSHAKYGREIVTGSASTGDYFRLHLNQHGEVQTITCLSRTPFPASNYLCLYGESEQLLNRLCERCDEGLVSDLYR